MNSSESEYKRAFEQFLGSLKLDQLDILYPHFLECFFEQTKDWSEFLSLQQVRENFIARRKSSEMIVEDVDLREMELWSMNKDLGVIEHQSGDFFKVQGIRVRTGTREVSGGWDQPIVTQIGYDGGILGLLRKRFRGVPHYLCELKEEPGNYGKIQISPTLQATFANIRKSHGGRVPYFYDFFDLTESIDFRTILFDAWLAEDGGRLHLKRNRGMLVEIDEHREVPLPNENFIWLSLFQIKALMVEDAWVNPHVRGILAHV